MKSAMAKPLRFNFVCARRFAELPGEGLRVRHCSDCDLDVHNLDVMPMWERSLILKEAAASNTRLCVSVTQPSSDLEPCPRTSAAPGGDGVWDDFETFATAGEPCLDDYDKLDHSDVPLDVRADRLPEAIDLSLGPDELESALSEIRTPARNDGAA
jgi:hypothetical protein